MKHFTLLFACLVAALSSTSQLIPEWRNNTGLFPNDTKAVIKFDHDGNVIIARSISYAGSNFGHAINKYTPAGELVWSVVEDDASDNYNFGMNDIAIGPDNSIVLAGSEYSSEDLNSHSALMIINEDGSPGWSGALSSVNDWGETLTSVVVDDDGAIYVSGTMYDEGVQATVDAMMKLNSEGVIEWTHYNTEEGFGFLEEGNDGNLYTVNEDVVTVFDTDGETVDMAYVNYDVEAFYFTPATPDYIRFTGSESRIINIVYPKSGYEQLGVLGYSVDGGVLWSTLIDVYDLSTEEVIEPVDFEVDAEGNTYVAGNYYHLGGEDAGGEGEPGTILEFTGVFAAAISNTGEIIWQSYIDNAGEVNTLYAVATVINDLDQFLVVYNTGNPTFSKQIVNDYHTTDGEILWTDIEMITDDYDALQPRYAEISEQGAIYTSGIGVYLSKGEFQTLYLNKYDPLSAGISGVENGHLALYPNPAFNTIYVDAPAGDLDIYDATGRLVRSYRGNLAPGIRAVDVSMIAPGSYYISSGSMTAVFIKN